MEEQGETRDVLVEFSMSPMDQGSSLSRFVARSVDIIDRSGLAYRLGPMGTCLEGTFKECFSVIEQCFERMRRDSDRISLSIKADYRKGKTGRLEGKIRSVEDKLGRPVRT